MLTWDHTAQSAASEALRTAVARDEVGHAFVLVGPQGVGQREIARVLTAALNCDNPSDGNPCQVCATCNRVQRDSHSALVTFEPEGANHLVASVRDEWIHTASRTMSEGRRRIIRIVAADRMNESAQNSFLKALEEPPPGTVWILDLADPEEVPDTILSRCRVVPFAAWTLDGLLALAGQLGLEGPDAALVARAAMGSPTTLRRLADPQSLEDFRTHRQWISRVRADGPGYALQATAALKAEVQRRGKAIDVEGANALESLTELYGDQPPRPVVKELEERYKRLSRAEQTITIQQALDDVVTWCRDVVVVAKGGDSGSVRNIDAMAALREDAETFSVATLLDVCDTALHTREAIEVNVKWDLAIEAFVLGAHARALAG